MTAAGQATATIDDATIDKIVLLLVSGMPPGAILAAVRTLELSEAAAAAAIAEARLRIGIAARIDRDHETGAALIRLNDLYRRALTIQDTKTALAAQREINRLLDLGAAAHLAGQAGADAAELDEARRHLAPLALAPPDTPLPELCRLAVLRILAAPPPPQ